MDKMHSLHEKDGVREKVSLLYRLQVLLSVIKHFSHKKFFFNPDRNRRGKAFQSLGAKA